MATVLPAAAAALSGWQCPVFLAAGDFNGDAVPDLAVSNYANGAGNTVSILLGGTVTNAKLLNVPVIGIGVHDIQSAYTPNINFYMGSESNIVPVKPQPPGTTTVVTSSLNPSEPTKPSLSRRRLPRKVSLLRAM